MEINELRIVPRKVPSDGSLARNCTRRADGLAEGTLHELFKISFASYYNVALGVGET